MSSIYIEWSKLFFCFSHREVLIMDIVLRLEPTVVLFYRRLAEATGLSLEQVLCDALFKLAGELSMEALRHTE